METSRRCRVAFAEKPTPAYKEGRAASFRGRHSQLIVATLGLWAVDITGQGKPSYAPPRTPWGDPDLQGTYTNKYEQSTPLERPEEFAGRRVEDVSGAELADVLAKRDKQVVERPAGSGPASVSRPARGHERQSRVVDRRSS